MRDHKEIYIKMNKCTLRTYIVNIYRDIKDNMHIFKERYVGYNSFYMVKSMGLKGNIMFRHVK